MASEPKPKHVELMTYLPIRQGIDRLADQWAGKLVLVIGWWPSWTQVGFEDPVTQTKPLFRLHWKARIAELPDRWISDMELRRL